MDLYDEIIKDKKLRSIALAEEPMTWLDFYFTDYFGTPESYKEVIDRIESGGNLIRFGYRGCAKTSIIRKRLCKNIATRRNKFIRRTSYDVGKSEDNITSISNMLIGSEYSTFVHDYGRLYYNEAPMSLYKQKEQKRTSGFTTSNGVIVKANSVKKSTRGLNMFVRNESLRPDLDILDDIDDDENTQNPAIITKTYNKVKGAIFGGGTGQKIILGNTINEDGVLPRLAEEYKNNKRWKIVYTKFIENGKLHRPERFVKTQEEADAINETRSNHSHHVVSMQSLQEDNGRDWFGANYLLQPLRNGVSVIEEQWIRYEEYVPITYGHKTYISIDNAESEEDNSDPIGINVGTWIPEKTKWNIRRAGELKGRQKDLKKVDEKLTRLSEKFNTKEFIIENKAGGITLRKYLIQKHPDWIIYLYDPKKLSKIGRLRQVQPYLESAKVVFSPDIDQSFIKDLVKYPNIEHDDKIDSFTALILKHRVSLLQMEKENEIQNDKVKALESNPKKDTSNEVSAESKATELLNKYRGVNTRFTQDF